MTLKYPTTWGSTGTTAKSYPSVSAYTPLTGKTSSSSYPSLSSFSTLKGATGNTLYPAPKAATSYPSVSAYQGKLTAPSSSSGFPSLSQFTPKQTSFSTPRESTSSSYPSLSSWYPSASSTPTSATSKTASGIQQPSSFFSGFTSGGAAPTGASQQHTMSMPSGFASQALGGGTPPAPSAYRPQQQQPLPQRPSAPAAQSGTGYGMSAPSAQTNTINKLAQQNNQVNANAQKYGGPPKGEGRYATLEEANYHSGRANGQVTGDSSWSNGYMFDTKPRADGTYGVYPKGQPAPAAPARPAAPPVIVGRPTQTGQPVSIPVNRQPTQDEIDAANQGRWLG